MRVKVYTARMPDAPIRIVFCGTSAFAVPSLETLARDPRFQIDLVITQPDKPVGKEQTVTPPPVKVAAEKLGLKIAQPESLNKEFSNVTSQILARPDFLIVVSYGQILSQEVLDWPLQMPLNLHASLLPRWRGASPIQHAILAGDSETGVTVQKIEKELDAGPILAQEKTGIDPEETATELSDRLAKIGAMLLVYTLRDPPLLREQSADGITICRKLTREDGKVDPATMTALEIDRRVHALNPWPGVLVEVNGKPLKLLRTSLRPHPDAAPLLCKDATTLSLIEVQPPSKKPMTGKEWERGAR